ncbi:MAG TPA: AtpZ/AtpI family protein [Acidobacteriaceae bacterium]
MPDPPVQEDPDKNANGLKGYAQAETILQFALAIPGGAFAGLGIGYLLDRRFNQHWIAVTLMLLGAAGGFYQLFSYLTRRSGK